MAYIGHRCDCGHTDLQHAGDGTGTSLGSCAGTCPRVCGPMPEPELRPTFDGKGRPVERIIPPGEGLPTMGDAVTARTCACDGCAALYEQLTAA